MPTASIIIASYNGRKYLPACLTSVLEQIADEDQVILVDNASQDGTPELVTEAFPQVRLIRNQANCGFAAACNQGAAEAAGEVLVFLNQDTYVAPGWLDQLVGGLLGESGVGLATSRLLLMSEPDRIQMCGQDVHYTGLVYGRGYYTPAQTMPSSDDVFAVSGASFAIRRTDWDALGGLDETFYMYYEETDLSWRAQLAGLACRYVPDSVAYHDYHDSQKSSLQLYYSFRNRVLMLFKNYSGYAFVALLPGLILAELITWGLAFQYGWKGIRAKLRASLWILLHLNAIRGSRQAAQKKRQVPDRVILDRLNSRFEPGLERKSGWLRRLISWGNRLFRLQYKLARTLLAPVG